MNYGEILKRAWDTIWKHKILWVFGLLASCTASSNGGGGGGGGGGTNTNYSNGDYFNNGNPFSYNFEKEFGNMPSFNHMFSGDGSEWAIIGLIILGILCLVVLLSLLFIAIGSAGQIGLSRGAWLVDEGETKLTFSTLWQSIKKPFWRVFLMHFLLSLLGFVLGLLIVGIVVVIAVLTLGIGLICLIPFLCIFGLLGFVAGILINIMMQLMIPMMVNEDVGLLDAVKKSFALLKNNFWPPVLMGIILFVIEIAISLIIVIPLIILVLGGVGVGAFASGFGEMDPTLIIVLIIGVLCLFMPVSLFVNAVLYAYLGSAWTITYRRLTNREYLGADIMPSDEIKSSALEVESAIPVEEPLEEVAKKKPRTRKKKTDQE
ncbi:MAG: hypothetical protein JEZ00_04905 [Anaerolineaceae bacterium]|nr:hypothetical protein [Anaerolineaceae bacterium]